MLRKSAVDFIYNSVSQTAKGAVHNLHTLMARVGQPFYIQIIHAAYHYLTTDDLSRLNHCLQPFRFQHKLRRFTVDNPSGQTVNPFPHSTTCIFILLCIPDTYVT